tara:strand:+ start:25 stop:330 length:306 start_codon:yes stop_codon:yes gene_type:complete
MNSKQMNSLMEKIQKEITKTRKSGQKEYAHKKDNVFANFERIGDALDISREKVLMVYLLKHVDGIKAYVNGYKSQREDVRGRLSDIIVYSMLLWGMVEEDS